MSKTHNIDQSNMAFVIERMPYQLEAIDDIHSQFLPTGSYSRVFLIGMGGSGLAADVIIDAYRAELKVPVTIVRNYELGMPVTDRDLYIICSFSGNTEETLFVAEQLFKTTSNIIVITGGGVLYDLAQSNNCTLIPIPVTNEPCGFQPRSALGYFVSILIKVFVAYEFLPDIHHELKNAALLLKNQNSLIEAEAKEVAEWLDGKIPVIYTNASYMQSIGRINKIKINENSKLPAFYNGFPEVNHNEMVGFQKDLARFGILFLHDPSDDQRILDRYNTMQAMFDEQGYNHVSFYKWLMPGSTRIEKILCSLWFGDYCSYYLAIQSGVDPTPVGLIDQFKIRLDEME